MAHHDHDHHGHDHDHGEEVLEFSAKKPSKLKSLDADALIHVDGLEAGFFAVASSKKELKKLMKSDADVVYDEKKGKLYLNDNGTAKGWGKKKVGGLIARFKGKPELSADHFDGLSAHTLALQSIGGAGGNNGKVGIKDQIASYREILTDSEEADLLVDFTLEPKKALKRVIKDGKKEGYVFDRDELAEELEEMNNGGAFTDIELDAAAMEAMFSQGGEQEYSRRGGC